jgi:hypothetical protein
VKSIAAVLLLVCACSNKSADPVIVDQPPPPAKTAPAPAAPAKPAVDLAKVAAMIPAGMQTVTRFGARGEIVEMIGALGDAQTQPCWQALIPKMTDMFSFANIHTQKSVAVVTGDLPRKDVEACVAQVFAKDPYKVAIGADGDLATFAMAGGDPIYVAWKDGLVVAGDKSAVTEALTAPRATENWAARLSALPPTFQLMEMASIDPIATTLLGVPTTGYDMVGVTERPAKAHVIIHATSPADAAAIAKKVGANDIQWGAEMPAAFGDAIRKTTVAVKGSDVDVLVDQANFAGVPDEDLAKLGRLLTGGE